VWLLEHVFEETELVEQMRCARLQYLTAKFALEGLVPLEHEDLGAALGEQADPASGLRVHRDDACVDMNGSHDKNSLRTTRNLATKQTMFYRRARA
jgi:hypothetical protein